MIDWRDPMIHRAREQEFVQHVLRLLEDDRLRVDTTLGRRPVTGLRVHVKRENDEVGLIRLMSELDRPDRELQSRMPLGEQITVTLSRMRWFVVPQMVGRMRVLCLSPVRQLLQGQAGIPLNEHDLKSILAGCGCEGPHPVPTTVVVMSTSGFTREAHGLVERRADRTLILVEPNTAGGWTTTGPQETRALVDLFDPEAENEKRRRIRQEIERRRADLVDGSLSADQLASAVQLPVSLVEAEVKCYASANGLVARRLGGTLVLFREGVMPALAGRPGGPDMPFIERVKSLFLRKGENEKKLSLLSERRAALTQQRDRAYEEMGLLEAKEDELRRQFKESSSAIARRRITSQLVQLRKDLERRQQVLGMLNQQIDVISTHLHNLELLQQGKAAKLPDADELASDAAAAERVLADLQAASEMAQSAGLISGAGMTEEEQALYEELEREAAGEAGRPVPAEPEEARGGIRAAGETAGDVRSESSPPGASGETEQKQRSAPEPG